MADDRHYVPGDNYILDDLSGMKIRASKARIIPGGQTGGLAVSPARWEDQQPQDFVIGISDEIAADLVRSRQPDKFVVLGTYVIAPSARQTSFITIASPFGFTVGSVLLIMLDSGENQITTISAISGNVFLLTSKLNATVGQFYGDPIENSVLALSIGGPSNNGFYNDGGVLGLVIPSSWPTPMAVGTAGFYSNGGVASVAPGAVYNPSFPAFYFGLISSQALLQLGGNCLPTTASPGTSQLYNPGGAAGGDIWVA